MSLIYGSVCSGIEAASVAWQPLGWHAAFFSEIEPFPSAVLAHHYPDVPNLGDMTQFKEWPDHAIDVLVGGTPCQSFSVAGLRKGLDDPRGHLMLTYLAIAGRYRPRWLVWENVPGVLSSDNGRDFGAFLGALAELGYGFAYRVLDAQYFGVPQRRRRVFVVGCLGDWRRAAAVLFERESLRRDSPPRREARQDVAGTLNARTQGGGGLGTDFECNGGLIASADELSHCLNAGGMGRLDYESETFVTHTLRGEGFDASEDGTGRGTPLIPIPFDTTQITSAKNYSNPHAGDPCHPLTAGAHAPSIAFDCKASGRNDFAVGDVAPTLRSMGHAGSHANGGGHAAVMQPYTLAIRGRGESYNLEYRQDGTANAILTPNGGRAGIGVGAVAIHAAVAFTVSERSGGFAWEREVTPTLDATGGAMPNQQYGIRSGLSVRRLTPRECERLMGFSDDYTAITYRGKPAADGPRYKALGNSMAVPCMSWIGKRIQMVRGAAA